MDTLNEALPKIAESVVWPDSTEGLCIWCGVAATLIKKGDFPQPSVFQCDNCKRMFSASDGEEKQEFYKVLQHTIYSHWGGIDFGTPTATEIIQALMRPDLEKGRALIRERAGEIAEVTKRPHTHSSSQCWCEYGGLEFEAIGVYDQNGAMIGDGGGPLYDWHV